MELGCNVRYRGKRGIEVRWLPKNSCKAPNSFQYVHLPMLECFTTVIKISFRVGRVIWHIFFQFLKAIVKKQSKESA